MNQPFYGEQAKPELPADRVHASITLMTLANAEISYAAAMAALDPGMRPARLSEVTVRSGDWQRLENHVERGLSAARRLVAQLASFAETHRPQTVLEARDRFTCLKDLAVQHRKAQVSGYLSTIEQSDVDGLLAAVAKRAALEADLGELLDATPLEIKDRLAGYAEPMEAALTLTRRYGVFSLDEANAYEIAASNRESELLERLGRLSGLSGRLNVKAMTLGEARTLAAACQKVADRGNEIITAMREPGVENRDLIESIAARRDKIVNACRILDEKFGTAWRLQPVDKLANAAAIAATDNDPRHPRVVEYARSFGIDTKIPQSLDGAAKTLRAGQRLKDDATLAAAFPTTFKGLDTDMDLLRAASDFVAELRADIGRVRGGEALVSVFRTNSRRVLEEFLGYGALQEDIDVIGAPADLVIDEVYALYRSDMARFRQLLGVVTSTAAGGPPNIRTLVKISEVSAALEKADREMVENRHFIASGVHHPREIADSVDWFEAMTELTGEPPKGDEALANFAIIARDGENLVREIISANHGVCQALGRDDTIDVMPILDIIASFEATAPLREVHAARALICRSEEDAARVGLIPFVAELRGTGAETARWMDLLDQRYGLLDRLLADDAFARDLSAAAEEVSRDGPAPDDLTKAAPAAGSPGWVEEDIFVVPSKDTEAA